MNTKHYTLGLIKPLALKQKHHFNILKDIENSKIGKIVTFKRFKFSESLAKEFYNSLSDLPFFPDLIKNMTSGDTIGFIIEGDENIVLNYRKIMGATNPKEAQEGTLRFNYAKNIDNNAVHGSDSNDSANREINLIFPNFK